MKKIAWILGIIVILFLIFTVALTLTAKTKQPTAKKQDFTVNEEQVMKNLSEAVQFKTVSTEKREDVDYKEFDEFLSYLEKTYPTIYEKLDVEIINEYSLIFKWQGSDTSAKPIGLAGHYDVVPVAKGTESTWEQQPFSGVIDDEYIWGRGTLDDKVGVIGILEAVDYLLQQDYTPPQDIYLFFGHDEEIGGEEGAAKITEYFASKNIEFDYIMDEGGAIVENMVPGVKNPVGVIGVAEKGSATATLKVQGSGGHSSQPKSTTTIGRLGKAIASLEETQFSADITGPTKELFDFTAPEMGFGYKYIFENQWLFKPVIKKILLGKPATAAVTRSTIAPTIMNAGEKDNILPENAEAIINIRVMPGDTLESLKKQMDDIIDDSKVKVTIEGDESSKVSSTTSKGFKAIQQAAVNTNTEVITAPYMMIGASDAKHYNKVAKDAYRYLPVEMEEDGLERMHGTNERIKKEAFINVVNFYVDLMKQ